MSKRTLTDMTGHDSDSEYSDSPIMSSSNAHHVAMNESHTHAVLQHTLSQHGGANGINVSSSNPSSEELLQWHAVNNGLDSFVPSRDLHGHNAIFDLTDQDTLVNIFIRLLPSDLLVRIFESYPPEHWVYTSGTAHGKVLQGRPNLRLIYQYFAIYIRSIGLLENQPTSTGGSSGSAGVGGDGEGKSDMISSPRPIEFPRKRGRPPSNPAAIAAAAAAAAAAHAASLSTASIPVVPAVGTDDANADPAANLLALNRSGANAGAAAAPIVAPAAPRDDQKRPLRNCIKECIDHFIVRINTANVNAANAAAAANNSVASAVNASLAAAALASGARIDRQVPGYDMMEKFWSRFHIREQFYDEIFANFQNLLLSPGDYLVTNEHLLYFQGHSNQIQFTLNRSNDKHGLYFFSCHCVLKDPFTLANTGATGSSSGAGSSSSSGAHHGGSSSSGVPSGGRGVGNSYLLHGKLFYSNPKQGRVPNMDDYLHDWQAIYHQFQVKAPIAAAASTGSESSSAAAVNAAAASSNQLKLLLHHNSLSEDSLDREIHQELSSTGGVLANGENDPNFTPFLSLANTTKFPKMMHILTHRCGKLRQRGDLIAINNEKKSSLSVSYWDGDSLIGKRNYVTNLFHKQMSSTNIQTGEVYHPVKIEEINQTIASVFRSYGNTFAEEMHDRKLCHKTGGKSKLGQDGQEHKLILACILHNAFAAYGFLHGNSSVNGKLVQDMTFPELCLQLSDELFDFALTINA